MQKKTSSFQTCRLATVAAASILAACSSGGTGTTPGGATGDTKLGNSDSIIADGSPSFGSADAFGAGATDTGAGAAQDTDNSTAPVDAGGPLGNDDAGSGGHAVDAGPKDCPGGLGCPCDVAKDCDSKVCVQVKTTKICVPKCAPTTPPDEVCDGQDNDCNGQIDDGKLCTDSNPCTAAQCKNGKCSYPQLPCDDGIKCTKDSCDPMTGCAHDKDHFACDDNNPCTDEICDLAKGCTVTGTGCDDSDPCTNDGCDLALGCTHTAAVCDDSNPCTQDACDKGSGGCQHNLAGNGSTCDDGNKCTVGSTCTGGTCQAGAAKNCPSSGPCMAASCDAKTGACSEKPIADGGKCDDGSVCTTGDACKTGKCATTGNKTCKDEDPCTVDSCDPVDGCVFKAGNVGKPCTDFDKCTSNDKCTMQSDKSVCKGVLTVKCGSGKPCVAPTCEPKTGKCTTKPATAGTKCNDGSFCTLSDTCQLAGGKLTCTGKPLFCKDHNQCTADSCNAKTGACVFAAIPNGKACNDDNVCTSGEVCSKVGGQSVCSGGETKSCNDAKVCTNDVCDPKSGKCTHLPAGGSVKCNDGKNCTIDDACAAGKCTGQPKPCDDGNICTLDQCSNASGKCLHEGIKGCDPNACAAWSVSYGNEAENPKYSTSTEYLFGVRRAKVGGGSFAGGYVYTGSGNSYQGLIVRRDDKGKKTWARMYGNASNKYDFLRAVVPMSDGGVIGVGYATATTGSYLNGWVVRAKSNGSQVFSKQYGGSYYDYFYGAAAYGTGVVAVGHRRTSSSARNTPWFYFMDANGNKTGLGDRLVPVSKEHTYMQAVAVDAKTSDVFAAGYVYVPGKSNEGIVVRLSKNGAIKNVVVPGGTSGDYLRAITVLGNGYIAAAGSKYTPSTTYSDGWLVRMSTNLTSVGQWTYGSITKKSDYFYGLARVSATMVVAAGYYGNGKNGGYDGWTIGLNPMTGKKVGFDTRHGGTSNDYLYAADADVSGHVLVAGRTYSDTAAKNGDTWQLRVSSKGKSDCGGTDPGGNTCKFWQKTEAMAWPTSTIYDSSEYAYAVVTAPKGGTLSAGYARTQSKSYQGFAVRYDEFGKVLWKKHYGGSSSDYLRGAAANPDGTFWLAGYTSTNSAGSYDGWLVKVASNGTATKEIRRGSSKYEAWRGADSDEKGGVVTAGYRDMGGTSGRSAWTAWYNSSGVMTGWKEKMWGGTGNQYLSAVDYDPKTKNTYTAGYKYVSGKSNEAWVCRITVNGASISCLTYSGTGSEVLWGIKVHPLLGYVYGVGYTSTATKGGLDGFVVRATTSLSSPAARAIGGVKTDFFYDVTVNSKFNVVAAGYSSETGNYDAWVREISWISLNPTGLEKRWGSSSSDYLYAIDKTKHGLVTAGRTGKKSSDYDTWTSSMSEKGVLSCK